MPEPTIENNIKLKLFEYELIESISEITLNDIKIYNDKKLLICNGYVRGWLRYKIRNYKKTDGFNINNIRNWNTFNLDADYLEYTFNGDDYILAIYFN